VGSTVVVVIHHQARHDLLVPRLALLLRDHAAQAAVVAPGAPLRETLRWDAVYLAAGLASYTLPNHVDFSQVVMMRS
jgi:hypothetical protein